MNNLKDVFFKICGFPIIGKIILKKWLTKKYGNRVITSNKVNNYLQVQKDFKSKTVEVTSKPYFLNLDTQNICNLACPYCPTGTGLMKRKKTRLSFERAKRIIDEVKDYVIEIRLYNWGEPFLNPELFQIIKYAHDQGLYTFVHSNFSIKNEELIDSIIESRLDRLSVSMDGLTQETFQKYRVNGKLDVVLRNIKLLVDARKKSQSQRPFIEVGFIVFKFNEHELLQLDEMKNQLEINSFYPRRGFIFDQAMIPTHPKYQPQLYVFEDTCHFLYSELTVEADGKISPCCTNTDEKWDVGTIEDVLKLGFSNFWNNEFYRNMRNHFSNPTHTHEILCKHCQFVKGPSSETRKLSPLPPSFLAKKLKYKHFGS